MRNAADVPWHLQFAAALVGGRLQEQLLRPLLRFQELSGVHLAFAKNAAQHPEVVAAARSASRRLPGAGRPPCVAIHRPGKLFHQRAQCGKRVAAKKWRILYMSQNVEELSGLTPDQAASSRSFHELVRDCCPRAM